MAGSAKKSEGRGTCSAREGTFRLQGGEGNGPEGAGLLCQEPPEAQGVEGGREQGEEWQEVTAQIGQGDIVCLGDHRIKHLRVCLSRAQLHKSSCNSSWSLEWERVFLQRSD